MSRSLVLLATHFLPALLCLANPARADDDAWFEPERSENTAYFAPKLKFSTVNDRLALWPGARIGWALGSVLTAGFEGYILANEVYAAHSDTDHLSMAVAGVVFEAIPSPKRRTHMVLSLLIGGGGAQVGGDTDLDTLSEHGFTVLEPGISLEFNLTRKIRISPGVSYLWISGTVPGVDSKWDASERAFNLTLRFRDP